MPQWVGYHVKTDGRAYFRPYIPKDLKAALGPYPMVNLGMKASREAERLALMHYVAFEGLIEDKRRELLEEALKPRPRPLSEFTPEAIAKFATQLAQGFNRTQYAALREFRPREELLGLHELLSQLAGDVLSAQGMEGLAQVTAVFLVAAGIPYTLGEPNFKALVFEFATALDTEYIKPSTRRLHGREAVPPPPFPAAPQNPVAAPVRLTLGMVVERHLKKANQKKTGYTRKVVRCLTLFRDVIGANTPVIAIRQLHVTDFLGDICSLPSDWAAQFDKGDVTISALLASNPEKVMSPLTYTDNYRAPLKAFLRDSRRDYGDEGFPALIVDGIEYTGGREEGEDQQRALTFPELKTLFEGLDFAAIAADPQQEAMYWFPIICLFSGARPREVCQLNPQCDFGVSEGIHYMDFNARSAAGKGIKKTVKTGEERRIPLHPELIRLGLPAYLERIKAAGGDRMFPTFRVKKGNPYEAAGGEFTELLKTVGLYDNMAPPGRQVLGAYTLKKSFITHASNQRVVSREITGHSEDTRIQVRHYITEPEPLVLKDAELRKLVMPIAIPLRS